MDQLPTTRHGCPGGRAAATGVAATSLRRPVQTVTCTVQPRPTRRAESPHPGASDVRPCLASCRRDQLAVGERPLTDPSGWSPVEALFAELIDAAPEDRRGALASVRDAGIAAEVESLLAAHDALRTSRSGFLESLDAARAGALVESTDDQPDTKTIGRYPVVRRLARGGMGIVYLARDTRLDRLVALKLLPAYRSAHAASVERLMAEARTASSLDHPNIATVHEIAEADDGRLFIVMAYYDGETLRERMRRGAMSPAEVVRLGIQLAEGLEAAHRAGVVHQDVKPENLIITTGGVLKIVDFGIARAVHDDLPADLLPRGTAAYMSPEQSQGAVVDHRTDLWSAGVVLHEMLAGSRPPAAATTPRGHLAEGLRTLVKRCLEADPARRPASAEVLATELRALAARRGRSRRVARFAAAAALAGGVAAAALISGREAGVAAPVTAAAPPGVAVLPFDVRGNDLEIWREGMADLISTNLDGVPGLRAIDSRTVLGGWRREVEGGGAPDFDRALAFARRTGAAYAVFGSVLSSGADLRLSARIHSVEDRRSLGTVSVGGPADSIFALVDRLSLDLLALMAEGSAGAAVPINLARSMTTSLPALKLYLNGEHALRRADFAVAIPAYERAIAADSTFAFALYHLGVAHGWIGDQTEGDTERRLDYMRRALHYADRLPAREQVLLRAALDLYTSDGSDLAATLRLLREATHRYPDDAEAWNLLGELVYHSGDQLLLERDESEHALRRAVELDPGYAPSYVHLIHNAFEHRPDSARADSLIQTYRALAPNSLIGRENERALILAFGDSLRREAMLTELDSAPPGTVGPWSGFDHPRFWHVGLATLRPGLRPGTALGRFMAVAHFRLTLGLGKVDAALVSLADTAIFPSFRPAALYQMNVEGFALPPGVLEAALAMPPADTMDDGIGAVIRLFYYGAHAADRNRWEAHAAGVNRLRSRAGRLLARGDSAAARFAGGAAAALEARGLQRRGEPRRALPLMLAAQRQTMWVNSTTRTALNATIRWWLGELSLELERPADAVRYFASLRSDVPAAHRRARLLEELGRPEEARTAYLFVAAAWADADPELQPCAHEARARARALRTPPTEPRSGRSSPRGACTDTGTRRPDRT